MARPLRAHFEGAIYHVTSRGNERKNIVRSDKDRELFIRVLAQMLEDYHVVCHALEGMKSKKCPWDEVHGACYGGEELKGKLREIFKRKKRDLEVPLFHHRLEKHDPDRVLESVAKAFKLEVAEVLRVTRRPNGARDVAIWLLRKESGLSLREIGVNLE